MNPTNVFVKEGAIENPKDYDPYQNSLKNFLEKNILNLANIRNADLLVPMLVDERTWGDALEYRHATGKEQGIIQGRKEAELLERKE